MRTPRAGRTRLAWRGLAACACLLASCARTPPERTAETADGVRPAVPAAAAPTVRDWPLPATRGAAQPDLALSPSGELLLSWVEPAGEGRHRLRFSRAAPVADGGGWSEPRTIAEGGGWFVNWADTPHLYALADGSLWAHWLRSTGPGRMDYGIDLVRSGDGGAHWTPPRLVHPPGGRGDHGFVTFWPQAPDRLGIAWLDSRQKSAGGLQAGHDHGHGGGAMMLRAAVYGPEARWTGEWALDASTCDCCTTASAPTERGVVVVYRGRGADEVRDTRIVRFDGTAWTAPRDVHADGWRIAGCPVNGPAVAARGRTVWAAWYTEAGGMPELRAARSDDAGDSFGAPATLAKGAHVLGRPALALDGEQPLAAWLEQAADGSQRLVLGRYAPDWRAGRVAEAARLAARGRASGMPRLRWAGDAAWLVWTDVHDGVPVLRGASVR